MSAYFTESDMHKKVEEFVAAAGSQKEAARQMCISVQYLNDVLQRRRGIGNGVSAPMGYEAVTMWRKRT